MRLSLISLVLREFLLFGIPVVRVRTICMSLKTYHLPLLVLCAVVF